MGMKSILTAWNRLRYIGTSQYDLLMAMMCADEDKRFSIDEVVEHPWIKDCFVKDENGMIQNILRDDGTVHVPKNLRSVDENQKKQIANVNSDVAQKADQPRTERNENAREVNQVMTSQGTEDLKNQENKNNEEKMEYF